MNKSVMVACFLLLPAISFGGENLNKRLWDEVGVELKKPFLRNYIVVKQVRPGSHAEIVGMQKGDRWVGNATLLEEKAEDQLQGDDFSYVFGYHNLNGKQILILGRTVLAKDLRAVSDLLLKTMSSHPCFKQPSLHYDLVRNAKRGQYTIKGIGQLKAIGVVLKEVSFGNHELELLEIEKVMANSPAEKSGLKANDLIARADDKETKYSEDLINKVRSLEIGSKIKLIIVRYELKPCPKEPDNTCFENLRQLTVDVPIDLTVTEPYGDIRWEKSEK